MKFKSRKEYLNFCRQDNTNYLINNKYVLLYARDKKNNPVGAVLAYLHPTSEVYIGWSLCCKTDRFCKVEAINRAARRAVLLDTVISSTDDTPLSIPQSLSKLVCQVADLAIIKFAKQQAKYLQLTIDELSQHAAGDCVIDKHGKVTQYVAEEESE